MTDNPYGPGNSGNPNDPYSQSSANQPQEHTGPIFDPTGAQGQPNPYGPQGPAGPGPQQNWGPGQQPGQDIYGNAPYGQPGQGGWTGGPASGPVTDGKGFFGALFDFSFNHFVTPKIIKIVYIVMTALIGLFFLLFLISALVTGDVLPILAALIIGPIVSVFYLALMRMSLEMYYAVIRLSEDVHNRLPRQ